MLQYTKFKEIPTARLNTLAQGTFHARAESRQPRADRAMRLRRREGSLEVAHQVPEHRVVPALEVLRPALLDRLRCELECAPVAQRAHLNDRERCETP